MSRFLLTALLITFSAAANAAPPTEGDRLFALKILPLMKEKCFGCHGQDREDIRGDYDMMTREGLLKGGESEEVALIPGKADESPLFHAINWTAMRCRRRRTIA